MLHNDNNPDLNKFQDNKVLPPELVKICADYMHDKFHKYGAILYRLTPESLTRFPGKVRGNSSYNASMSSRVFTIQKSISENVEIDSKKLRSNVAFVTLTAKSPDDDFDRAVEQWKYLSECRNKFFVNMKKNGVKSYVYAVESNGSAGYHIHTALVFDNPIQWKKDRKGAWRSDRIRDLVKWYWGSIEWQYNKDLGKKERVSVSHGFVDVKGSYTAGVAHYITKELFKQGSVEKVVKAIRKGSTVSMSDVKRVYAYALTSASNIRMFGVSRDIKVLDPEEDETESLEDLVENLRLDKDRNNPSYTMLITKKDLYSLFGINQYKAETLTLRPEPYCGTVKKGTFEDIVIRRYMMDRISSGLIKRNGCQKAPNVRQMETNETDYIW